MNAALPVYQQQQFDFLLHTAVERYVERLMYRCGGIGLALTRLRQDAEAEEVRLTEFVQAALRDFLLDNPAGAAFLLQAMSDAPAIAVATEGTIGQQMQALSVAAFSRLMRAKTEESLERESAFEAQPQESGR